MTEENRRALAQAIGDNLRRLRRDRGYTQRQVVGVVGCSLSYYQALEAGQHMGQPTNPTIDLLADLAAVFEVRIIELLKGL